ncbi:hypothetical protein AS850_06075 [Frondihabitans sp. 762G35]|nr:hypothetical protein AS850_06075 [Frondihabitans sp. 762G35]
MSSTPSAREQAVQIHKRITESSTKSAWSTQCIENESIPKWQLATVAALLALSQGEELDYVTSSLLEDRDWQIVAFTPRRVVRLVLTPSHSGELLTHGYVFGRGTLSAIELVSSPAPISTQDPWPGNLSMIARYAGATIPLPLDDFASPRNRSQIPRLLASLLKDVSG